jgi:sarcosine oxidase delta subunit
MRAIMALRSSASAMTCPHCGGPQMSPEGTYDFPQEGLIINLWSCPSCSNQFETEYKLVHAAAHQKSEEELAPTLLVA